ncbi:cytochrome c-type biogenesis protein CcmH [Arsenicitalea aurantiaca]|uniref:Cytochrome c-type biogenesis protein n=1 Tax=Arsenicitalea aurantiaca TaxID=1783274 RepID=A0A433XAC7_9HYPH|nr:cytochrome c-type biogenesis protein [Arsenicitalea aurantiaca]RUT30978.1 cytochrome c-type biogenesis protein CcmH [Arsenicitalea aurantiaca]
MKGLIAFLLALTLAIGPALAVNPDEILDDPVLESRARSISTNLRCLVCQNQSIDDSDAPLASDLRVLVRERLVEGDSDAQVLQFVVDRYGEFVLLRPVLGWHTILLWSAAPLILIAGGVAIFFGIRRRKAQPIPAAEGLTLSAEEEAALAALARNETPSDRAT